MLAWSRPTLFWHFSYSVFPTGPRPTLQTPLRAHYPITAISETIGCSPVVSEVQELKPTSDMCTRGAKAGQGRQNPGWSDGEKGTGMETTSEFQMEKGEKISGN